MFDLSLFVKYWDIVKNNLFLQVIFILAITILVAKIIAPMIVGFLHFLTRKTKSNFDDKIIEILRIPIFYTIIFLGVGFSIKYFNLFPKNFLLIVHILETLFIIVWLKPSVKSFKIFIDFLAKSPKTTFVNNQSVPLFNNLILLVVFITGVYILLTIWGINMTAWLASAGVMGIAVGFAAKDTLANLISGVFILADKPYQIGDFITLDSGERGQVIHVGVRSTRILTRSDSEITIPNAIMGNNKVTNETGGPHKKFRISIDVGVSYDSDLDFVKKILLEVANNDTLICSDPTPRVRFRAFGASSVDLSLLCWVEKPALKGRAVHQIGVAIFKKFKEENIQIPFPQMDVHLDK